MKFTWLKARQTKYTAYATAYIAVFLAILTAANWLANRHNKSFDTTANKRYSLADQTVKLVKGLKQDVTITLYDETSRFAQARDLLDQYDNLSPHLKVNYIDPDKKPQLARQAGITSLGTIHVERTGKREEARSLSEQEITSALIRLLKKGQKTVCFLSGSGEHSISDSEARGYSDAKDLLEKNNYRTQSISLLENPEIPKECSILVIGGPRYEYLERSVAEIKKFVENGGSALFLIDPPLETGSDRVSPNEKLLALLDEWGVILEKNLVLDTSGIGSLFQLGPEVPLVARYDTHPIVNSMRETATAFAIARSLKTQSRTKTSVQTLFSTTSNSYAVTDLKNERIRLDRSKAEKGPFSLGAAGTYDTGKENVKGRFVVVGSSDWIANYILRFQGNRDLFLNMVNWLSADEDLISIRPKEPEDRRIQLTQAQMRVLRTTSQFLLPLAMIALGLVVWWRRR